MPWACPANLDHRLLRSWHYHQLESQDMSLMTHVLYRGPAPGSGVVGARAGRGFFMAPCVGRRREGGSHEACHKPEMSS